MPTDRSHGGDGWIPVCPLSEGGRKLDLLVEHMAPTRYDSVSS